MEKPSAQSPILTVSGAPSSASANTLIASLYAKDQPLLCLTPSRLISISGILRHLT
jgi:hypothetical protein